MSFFKSIAKAVTGGSIWGSVISGVGSIAGGFLNSKSKDKDNAAQAQLTKEQIAAQGYQSRLNSQYEAELQDFFKQTDRARDRKVLNQYGKYNLMSNLMPTDSPGVEIPNRPINPTGGI
jgi:hypothetical protein